MNAEKIFGKNVYVNLDEVIETVYQCRRAEANDEWLKRWLKPLKSLPTIEVSEDCVSRKWLEEKAEFYSNFDDGDVWAVPLYTLSNAPSVVPSSAEGEWIDKGDYAECSNCGANSGTQFNGVEPVPLKTKFCPNCRAKMKGGADDVLEGDI